MTSSEFVDGAWWDNTEYEPEAIIAQTQDGQWIWWAKGRIGYADDKQKAQAAAERLLKEAT